MPELDPSHIMQVGMGFFASKTLLSAVELGLFTELAKQPMTGAEIVRTLGLNPRAVPDFPDALVALKFLERAGDGPDAHYSNTPESAMFLDRQSAGYIGGILEMANARLYRFWADLTEALKTGSAAERDEALGRADVRQALRDARTSRAVPQRHVGNLGWKLQDVRSEV